MAIKIIWGAIQKLSGKTLAFVQTSNVRLTLYQLRNVSIHNERINLCWGSDQALFHSVQQFNENLQFWEGTALQKNYICSYSVDLKSMMVFENLIHLIQLDHRR